MPNKETAIKVSDIKKSFRVYFDKGSSLKEKLLFWKRNRYETREVLRGVSLEISRGEAVGVIGVNGSGKSTMLKLLSRIMYPDAGTVAINGTVSSLIELGAGFHPDLSGRENIYTNAAIFGLKKKQINARLDDIIAFSELGDFIDSPVRTYSSGMYMRLAFSVAINVNADVLLVDEILAVGDTAFQAKCYDKLRSIKAAGVTVVIVSHDLKAIENFCDRSIWIDHGVIRCDGRPEDVHSQYLERVGSPEAASTAGNDAKRWGSREIEITDVAIRNPSDGGTGAPIRTGDDILIEYGYRVRGELPADVETGISLTRNDGTLIYGTNTALEGVRLNLSRNGGWVRILVEKNSLLGGTYFLGVAFHKKNGYPYDYWSECRMFYVLSGTADVGTARQFHTWQFE